MDSPYDWPKGHNLSKIDSLLRCPCCQEFFDTTGANIITICGHVHCVTCSVSWIGKHSKCPSCGITVHGESALKCVRVLNEVALLFRSVREELLKGLSRKGESNPTLSSTSMPSKYANKSTESIKLITKDPVSKETLDYKAAKSRFDISEDFSTSHSRNSSASHFENLSSTKASRHAGLTSNQKQSKSANSKIKVESESKGKSIMSAFKNRPKLNCPACHMTGFTESGLDLHLEKQCASSVDVEGPQNAVFENVREDVDDEEAPILKKQKVDTGVREIIRDKSPLAHVNMSGTKSNFEDLRSSTAATSKQGRELRRTSRSFSNEVIVIDDDDPVSDIKVPPLVPWSTLGI